MESELPGEADEADAAWERMYSYTTYIRHTLLLEESVDRHFKAVFTAMRGRGELTGIGLCSDESPPSAARLAGLRFQITVIYVPKFSPVSDWATARDPPVQPQTMFLDIVNVPGKTGTDLLDCWERQLARVGLELGDISSFCADGGGENTGITGSHALLLARNESVVSKTCLSHVPWRSCAHGLEASGETLTELHAMNAFLHQGVSWRRLQEIAVQGCDRGGAGLFEAGSVEFVKVFATAPPKVIDNRPESVVDFLGWLVGKDETLGKLAALDVNARNLRFDRVAMALKAFGCPEARAKRLLLYDLTRRSLGIYYTVKKSGLKAKILDFQQLADRSNLPSVSPTPSH